MDTSQKTSIIPIIGWREWVAVPELDIQSIKAKVDTGARTSALHTYFIDSYTKSKQPWICFGVHPDQQNTDITIECHAPVKDRRLVTDSGGHQQKRFVIETSLKIGSSKKNIEMTLTRRDNMKLRMLLGRTAMQDSFIVDPSNSYLMGFPNLSK